MVQTSTPQGVSEEKALGREKRKKKSSRGKKRVLRTQPRALALFRKRHQKRQTTKRRGKLSPMWKKTPKSSCATRQAKSPTAEKKLLREERAGRRQRKRASTEGQKAHKKQSDERRKMKNQDHKICISAKRKDNGRRRGPVNNRRRRKAQNGQGWQR